MTGLETNSRWEVVEEPETARSGVRGDDSIAEYLRQIGRFPLLSAAAERALCERIERAHGALATALRRVPEAGRRVAAFESTVKEDQSPGSWPRFLEALADETVSIGLGRAARRVRDRLGGVRGLRAFVAVGVHVGPADIRFVRITRIEIEIVHWMTSPA